MNLFEYQGKRLYQDFSIPTPKSIFVSSISEITDNHGLTYPVVVKAQVQVGGRGKAGGIKVAKDFDELTKFSDEILGYNAVNRDQKRWYDGQIEDFNIYLKKSFFIS